MKLKLLTVHSVSVTALLFGWMTFAHADSQPGDHALSITSDDVNTAGAHDFELSNSYFPSSSRSFSESFSLFVDKLLRVSAYVTENSGIQEFTSVGLYADNTLISEGVLDNGSNATASLLVSDLLPGTYELRVSGILNNTTEAGRFDVSADAVATPIPTATWFFAPAIATVFSLRKRKGRILQST